MKFERLLTLVGEQPLFETGLLLAGDVDPAHVQRQLSRWVRSDVFINSDAGYIPSPLLIKTSSHIHS